MNKSRKMIFIGHVALMGEICTEYLHESLEGRDLRGRLGICGRINIERILTFAHSV
jgi:hypothetical protein